MAKQLVVNDVETALIVSRPQVPFVGHNATKQHIVTINEPAEDGPIEIFLISRSGFPTELAADSISPLHLD